MRPVTDRFLTTVRGSHRMVSDAYVVAPGQTGVNPFLLDGVTSVASAAAAGTGGLLFSAGSVKLDATADIRGSLDLTTEGPFPRVSTDPLAPYGNEIFVRRGIEYGDGGTEMVSQGYYRIESVTQDVAPNGEVQVTAFDRMAGIVDSKPLAPMQFGVGASVSSVFSFLIGQVYPGAVIIFDFDASVGFSAAHNLEDDRYAFLRDIADSFGKIMYWDYAGRLVVKTAPASTVSVFDVTHGRGGVIVKATKTLSRNSTPNAVVATGEQVGQIAPAYGVAIDNNPTSPTYFYGPYGQVPVFYSSNLLTSNGQAYAAAQAQLARLTGLPYTVNFDAVPNPALEPLDCVRVSYGNAWSPELHTIDTLTLDLSAQGVMTATTRAQNFGGV